MRVTMVRARTDILSTTIEEVVPLTAALLKTSITTNNLASAVAWLVDRKQD